MNKVTIVDGAGKQIRVSRKAFQLIYKHKGFTLVPGKGAAADEADEPEGREDLSGDASDGTDAGQTAAVDGDVNSTVKGRARGGKAKAAKA